MRRGGSEAYIPAAKNSNSTTFSVFLFATCVFVYSYSDSSHLFNIKWPATAAIFRKKLLLFHSIVFHFWVNDKEREGKKWQFASD